MTVPENAADFQERFAEYLHTLDCVHCGLCLPNCPTYRVSGRESDSPRGRVYLLRGHAEGHLELTGEAKRHLDLCVVCRNCETVCPSGIRMGEMLEVFRDEEMRRNGAGGLRGFLARLLLRRVLPHRSRIAALTDLLSLFEKTGMRRVSQMLWRLVSRRFAGMESIIPTIPPRSQRRIDRQAAARGGLFPARGKPRVRVALFLGCIASEWYASVHQATIRVLTRNGCDVLVPREQTCCGALHRHSGYLQDAADLFTRNVRVFGNLKIDAVVVNAAGCGAALKEIPRIQGRQELPEMAVPVRDIFELLDEIGIVEPTRTIEKRAAHHQACHLVHAQKIGPGAVEDLLGKIPGLTLVPLEDADHCCGAGGIYNLLQPRMAQEILKAKIEAVTRSGAEIVVTGNPGCWLQIRSGLSGRGIEVLHPVELLDRAYAD